MTAYFILAGVIGLLGVVVGVLGYKALDYRHKFLALKQTRSEGLLADLELATSDQLFHQIRMRPGNPYILLTPIKNEEVQGINIECHNVPPEGMFPILHMATAMTMRELKNRGIEIPDFPEPDAE